MSDLDPQAQKELFKQAIKEWMDEKYADLGKWVLKKIVVAAVVSFLAWYISINGFKIP